MLRVRLSPSMPLVVVAVMILAGCTGINQEPHLLHRVSAPVPALVTDAKQRLVVKFEPGKALSQDNRQAICAEPSPDVTQAFSEALKVAVSLNRSAGSAPDNETTRNIGANFARSFSSSIAQLGERLAVIQLFRDRMYRACEAYANGAIDGSAYTLMLARADKTMATLLTAEMAAGAFGRTLARLGGSAGNGVADPEERAALQEKITRLTRELADLAKSDDANRAEQADAKAKELSEAHTLLLALDLSETRLAASSGIGRSAFGNVGSGSNRTGVPALKGELSDIHRAFLDDPGLEPLIDACLTAQSAINLDGKQAEGVNKASDEIHEAAKIADRDNNTIKFLRDILDTTEFDENENATNLTENEVDSLVKLGVMKNNGDISKTAIEDVIQKSEESKQNQQGIIRDAEIKIASNLLVAGSGFAAFCLTKIFGDLSDAGFIKTMISSRYELRKLDHELKLHEVELRRLAVCEQMLKAELTEEQRTEAIGFCRGAAIEVPPTAGASGKVQ